MPLRTAPLPRMAGHLSFMRTRRGSLDDLGPESLAIVGAPMEAPQSAKCGCRFAPRALRETSVYFGWHANPQFSHPVDVDRRVEIDTSAMHGRLIDIGDVALRDQPREPAEAAIATTMANIAGRGAGAILLGGDASVVAPGSLGAGSGMPCSVIQIGGPLDGPAAPLPRIWREGTADPGLTALVAPSHPPSIEALRILTSAGGVALGRAAAAAQSGMYWTELATRLSRAQGGLQVHLHLSALEATLHGMSAPPRFAGLSLSGLRAILTALGSTRPRCLIVTGLNPTLSGLSVVKTGQRLAVTALLGFIYARLGLLEAGSEKADQQQTRLA